MKTLLAAAAAALVIGVGPVSAQIYQPMSPPPAYQVDQGPVQQVEQTTIISGRAPWMDDDGSSSDYPIHNPGDRSGDALNSQYQGGITTAPGTGFPAYPGQR